MQRRSFLQALMAAAGGLTVAGRAAAAAVAPASPPPAAIKSASVTPGIAVTADTKQFERSLDESQRTVIEMLKDCRVTSLEKSVLVSGFESWTITYQHAPHAKRTSLDDQADEASRGRAPRSVSVTPLASSIDIATLDNFGYYETMSIDKGDYEIEVEWV